jgi:Photosynthetic reaction centre cytochrome C subunit
LKILSPSLPAALTALLFAIFAVATFAQTPEAQQPSAEGGEHHHHEPNPTPTNLKVLPKDMNGDQVHELMHKWSAALGTECGTCHAADPNHKMPNGRLALNYADDSKPEKNTARLMYRMVQDINKNYVSMVENSGVPVSCGTCHRGHIEPPLFVPPKGEHDHDHEHSAPPPAGEKPPAQ